MNKIENLPTFNIDLEKVIPELKDIIGRYKEAVEVVVEQNEPPTWDTFHNLTVMSDEYSKFVGPIGHLTSVRDTERLRELYEEAIPVMSEFGTWMGQNKRLSEVMGELKDSGTLTPEQQKSVDNDWLSFELSGVNLPDDKKQQYAEISQRLAELSNNFSKNTLDATKAWTYHTIDENELDGVPEATMAIYEQTAESKDLEGYLITLDHASILPLLTYCHNRELRELVSKASATKASSLSEYPEFDNTDIISEIMDLRFERSVLLGYDRPADVSLIRKMAGSPEQMMEFMYDISEKARPKAEADEITLQEFAKEKGCESLEAWDRVYYANKMKEEKCGVDSEVVKQYFQLDNVLGGLFDLVKSMYGIEIREENNDDIWDDGVRFCRLYKNNIHFASWYMDLHSAPERKRGGAWMDESMVRWNNKGTIQLPVAYIVCNFSPPTDSTPSLLSHDDVETIFHETGHGLHHVVTEVDIFDLSGINGVEWDAVELPSQIMEYWCWDKKIVQNMSEHYKTKEKLPDELFEKMLSAKNFMGGHALLRQMEFGLFDMLIHMVYNPADENSIRNLLNDVREKVSIVDTPDYNRFENSFSHIFAGGYAAGYYSYIHAEWLSADIHSEFDPERFLEMILSRGGTRTMKEMVYDYLGREPSMDALLRDRGIIE